MPPFINIYLDDLQWSFYDTCGPSYGYNDGNDGCCLGYNDALCKDADASYNYDEVRHLDGNPVRIVDRRDGTIVEIEALHCPLLYVKLIY